MRPWWILVAISLGRVAFGYQFQTVATMAPDLVPRFGLTYAALGTMIGAYMLPGAFVALPLGLLGGRFGDKPVLGCGLALMVLGSVVSAYADDPSGIGAGRIAAGVGAVAMIVLQGKVIADWFHGRRFMLAISVSVCSYPVGVGLAQLLLPPLDDAEGWRAAFLSGAALAATSFAIFVASYRTPADVQPGGRSFFLPSGRECLLLVIAGLCWTAYTSGWAGYASYLPSTMSARGETVGLIALAMTIATWGNVPFTLFGGGLAARFGGYRVFLIGTLSLVIGMAGTGLLGHPVSWSVLIGICGSLHPGVIMAVGTLSARPQHRAVGMAIFYSIYYLGGTLAPAICGRAADLYGSPAGGLLGAAAISFLAIPAYMLHRRLARHQEMLVRA